MSIVAGLVLFAMGMLYAQLVEWLLHKYLLHGWGKRRNTPFSFHFHGHHRASRTHLFRDAHYEQSMFAWKGAGKETWALLGLALLHLPLIAWVPAFWLGAVMGGGRYFHVHKKSHLDPDWCRTHLPWHYDHHMGPNQELNWGVTTDLFDRLFGTRQVYLGTPREQRDTARRMQRVSLE